MLPSNFDPPLRRLNPSENIYGRPCFDVRGFTRSVMTSTDDEQISHAFLERRRSDGREYLNALPEAAQPMPCDLHYPLVDWPDGPLFKAHEMEEKWDIFFRAGYLYFARSWTGQLIYRARVERGPTELVITQVDADPRRTAAEPGMPVFAVDFLVKSHLFGLDVPVHLPPVQFNNPIEAYQYKTNEPAQIGQLVFHEYGRKAGFATYANTITIPHLFERRRFLPGLFPLGLDNLSPHLEITENRVSCPVAGCTGTVERQHEHFKRLEQYRCPEHGLFISPSTFEYPHFSDALLWREPEDLQLLKSIFASKTENRLGRDNSEDALTWNVVRFLEQTGLLGEILSNIHGEPLEELEVLYWAHLRTEKDTWSELKTARLEFGERNFVTEPDLIVRTAQALFFIESKFTASINTKPTTRNPASKAAYQAAAGGWFSQVFQADYDTIAIEKQKYVLMRHWLLGSHIAHRLGLTFYLVSLTRTDQVQPVLDGFGPLQVESEERHFVATAWEELYHFVRDHANPTPQTHCLLAYLENKTAGYDKEGYIQPAFLRDFLFF
jgi:hypothetical protein